MASERFADALNAQIAREFAAAHQYVAVGNYYAAETFPRLGQPGTTPNRNRRG